MAGGAQEGKNVIDKRKFQWDNPRIEEYWQRPALRLIITIQLRLMNCSLSGESKADLIHI